MDKAWLWRKKSTEKPIVAADKVNGSPRGNDLNEEEIEALLAEKAELEKDLKTLSDKLASALSECNSKDEIVKKHSKMAQEAVQGWEKVEAEAASLKQELDRALQLRASSEDRVAQLDAALKECMQQLRFVREEQEQRVHDVMMKTSREFEKSQMVLEEKFAETTKRLSKIGAENTHLSKALLVKEKLIEDLRKQVTQVEADFNALMTRLESTEKDNASLKYEVRVLEKELEIRNEEREFNRRTADALHKQHLEGAKKIAKLESECQRLRLLVRKRLPGPAALAKMKNEVEMLGRDSVDMRRRKLNTNGLMYDSTVDNFPETPSTKINVLTEQLGAMEDENNILKEALNKKINELQLSRNMYARAASKLLHVELPLDSSRGQMTVEPMRSSFMSHEFSLASMSDIGSDDKVSCADSWASAFITELDHLRNEKQKGSPCKTVGSSDINLMDDFVEMEKLAVVSADKPSVGSHVSSPANVFVGSLEAEHSSELLGSEIVPVSDSESNFSLSNRDTKFQDIVDGKAPHWLQDIVKVLLEHNRVAGRNPEQILEDIRTALAYKTNPKPGQLVDAIENSSHFDASNPSCVKSCISWKGSNKSLETYSPCGVSDVDISLSKKSNQQLQPDLSNSISKIIELIEGISVPSPDYNTENESRKDGSLFAYKNSETNTGYMVRVFQWKSSELGALLQKFVHACYDLLNGKAGLDKFAQELTTALDWILNHCFSLQDVSSMKDAIKKQLDWDDTRSESEAEVGMVGNFSDTDKLRVPREQLSCMTMAASSNDHSMLIEELHANLVKQNRRLKVELVNIESAKRELEGRLQSASDKSEYLTNQLKESEKTIASLQTELQSLRESKGMIEDQISSQKMMNEDLDTQLTVARAELSEARQKFSSLEVELENKYNFCEELEATCLELQLQLESVKKKTPNSHLNQEGRQAQSEWEITAASEKLAECQETILNLGKQLKALAAPREAALFDKVITSPTDKNTTKATASAAATAAATATATATATANATTTTKDTGPTSRKLMNERSSLLDQMLAEDGAAAKDFTSPKTKEVDSNSTSTFGPKRVIEPLENMLNLNSKCQDENATVGPLVIVPGKKRGGGSLWRKLLWRKKKGNSMKAPITISS